MRVIVNAVAFEDAGVWIGQCLEHDIVTSAPTLHGLRQALERAVAANLRVNGKLGRDGLEGIPAAPERFQRMFERAGEGLVPRQTFDASLPVEIAALHLVQLEALGDL